MCEAYGYLPSDIQWMRDRQLIEAKGNYSLTTSSGNIDSIGSNGAIQKSQIISMHITEIDETIHNGVYVCKLKDIITINITLTIGGLKNRSTKYCFRYSLCYVSLESRWVVVCIRMCISYDNHALPGLALDTSFWFNIGVWHAIVYTGYTDVGLSHCRDYRQF